MCIRMRPGAQIILLCSLSRDDDVSRVYMYTCQIAAILADGEGGGGGEEGVKCGQRFTRGISLIRAPIKEAETTWKLTMLKTIFIYYMRATLFIFLSDLI